MSKEVKYNFQFENNFQFRRINKGYFLSSDFGQWHFLTFEEFQKLLLKDLDIQLFSTLEQKGLIKTETNNTLINQLTEHWDSPVNQRSAQLVIIHLTQRCNLTCSYCHSSAISVNAKGRDLNIERAKDICSFIAKLQKKYVTIAFQGGEPSLELDLISFICSRIKNDVKNQNKIVKFAITTNGTNHSKEFLELIETYNISTTISFDGPENIHNIYRKYENGEGSFTKALEFRNLLKEIIPESEIGAIMVITKKSLPYIKEIVDFYLSFGKNIFRLKPITKLGHAKAPNNWNDSGLEFDEFWDAYLETASILKKYYYLGKHISMEHELFFFLKKLLEGVNIGDVDTRNPCGIAEGVLSFDVNGKIYACHETKRLKDFYIGTAADNPKVLFSSEKVKAIRSFTNLSLIDACNKCSYKPFCTPCPAHNYQNFKDARVKPYESWECKKVLNLGDYLLNDFEENYSYYLDVWKLNKLNETIQYALI